MIIFLVLAFLFWMGCTIGWCIELFFRRFVSNRKLKIWVNPGFLVGPYLPLYGFGLCILFLLARLESVLPSKLALFAMMAVAMTLIEYIAGVIFIKGMHVKLWDYSDRKFNIQGIICPLFSFFWAVLGALYYFAIDPYILDALYWFADNLAFSFIVGIFYGVFSIDVVYSMQLVTKVKKYADEKQVIIKYELLRQQIREKAREQKEKIPFFIYFRNAGQMREHIARYVELDLAFKGFDIPGINKDDK